MYNTSADVSPTRAAYIENIVRGYKAPCARSYRNANDDGFAEDTDEVEMPLFHNFMPASTLYGTPPRPFT